MEITGPYLGSTFLVLCIILILSIWLVIWRLTVKHKRDGVAKTFSKEIRNLLLILVIFSIGFLTRWIGDTFFVTDIIDRNSQLCESGEGVYYICTPYGLSLYITSTQFFFDVIPIASILLFHHFNFQEKHDKEVRFRTTTEPTLYDYRHSMLLDMSSHAIVSD